MGQSETPGKILALAEHLCHEECEHVPKRGGHCDACTARHLVGLVASLDVDPEAVPCAFCGAPPRTLCWDKVNSRPAAGVHRMRYRAALRVAAGVTT